MKRGLSILTAIILLLATAGSSLAESASAQTDATTSATQAPSGETRYMGRITAVDSGTITLSVMGGMQQGGNGQPSGLPDSNAQSGGGQPSGTPPQGNNGQTNGSNGQAGGSNGQTGGGNAPQSGNGQIGGGNGGSAPQGGMPGDNGQGTTAETQTITIAITDATAITSQETQAALTAADLTADMMVSVTVSGDATSGYTALSIEVQATQPTPTDGTAAATTTGE